MMETEQVAPLVWDRKHKSENEVILSGLCARFPAVLSRFNRRREWIAARNAATLAAMSEETARASLTANGSNGLRWYERLPYGISAQMAADVTGLPCWIEWWEGSHRFSRCYTRGNAVRKFHTVAKAI
jgi:hypothetical protein